VVSALAALLCLAQNDNELFVLRPDCAECLTFSPVTGALRGSRVKRRLDVCLHADRAEAPVGAHREMGQALLRGGRVLERHEGHFCGNPTRTRIPVNTGSKAWLVRAHMFRAQGHQENGIREPTDGRRDSFRPWGRHPSRASWCASPRGRRASSSNRLQRVVGTQWRVVKSNEKE